MTRLVEFFRTGYPEGAPTTGYVPLLALLRRRLTDDEVSEVAADLAACGDAPIDDIDIGAAITRIIHELPAPDDIDRVRRWLEGRG